MFALDTGCDPITPSTSHLLAEIGIDADAVHEAIGPGAAPATRSVRTMSGRTQPPRT